MIGKPTKAKPKVVGGVTFRCYVVGILQTSWKSDDGRIECAVRYSGSTYFAAVDGKGLGKNFRRLDTAMKAAVALVRAKS